MNEQEKQLAEKIQVVKEIVDKRQNPFKVLKYIAENIPKDVWLLELELDDKRLKLVGYSKSWNSIKYNMEVLRREKGLLYNELIQSIPDLSLQSGASGFEYLCNSISKGLNIASTLTFKINNNAI